MQSETADFAQMPPPAELDKTYASSQIMAYSLPYAKIRRHLQNWKYI